MGKIKLGNFQKNLDTLSLFLYDKTKISLRGWVKFPAGGKACPHTQELGVGVDKPATPLRFASQSEAEGVESGERHIPAPTVIGRMVLKKYRGQFPHPSFGVGV